MKEVSAELFHSGGLKRFIQADYDTMVEFGQVWFNLQLVSPTVYTLPPSVF